MKVCAYEVSIAAYESGMHRDNRQPELPDFHLPFGGKLDPENRWVKLAQVIPWHLIEEDYRSNFATSGMGTPAKESRIALAALIIKERLGITDEETVAQIRENPLSLILPRAARIWTEARVAPVIIEEIVASPMMEKFSGAHGLISVFLEVMREVS